MSNAQEEFLAQKLANVIVALRALECFDTSAMGDTSTRVTWVRGSSLGGYKELSEAISVIVSERWNELRDEALTRARKRVDDVRAELLAELSKVKP